MLYVLRAIVNQLASKEQKVGRKKGENGNQDEDHSWEDCQTNSGRAPGLDQLEVHKLASHIVGDRQDARSLGYCPSIEVGDDDEFLEGYSAFDCCGL